MGVEDFDAGIRNGVVACSDHAPLASTKGKHGVVKGGCGARSDVNHGAAGESQTERQRRHERCVVRSSVPSHHDHAAFSGKCGLRVRERFTHQAHERGREGAFAVQSGNGIGFTHGLNRRQTTDAVGAEKRVFHANPSSVLAVWSVNTGDGHVGPDDAFATQNDARVGDAVATRGRPLAEHGTEFSQAAGNSVSSVSKMNFSAVVAKVAEFGPGPEVDPASED